MEPTDAADLAKSADAPDLAEVRGQFAAKRALEIAAAGEHGFLMIGRPASRRCSAGEPEIRRIDVAEAVQLRALDKLSC